MVVRMQPRLELAMLRWKFGRQPQNVFEAVRPVLLVVGDTPIPDADAHALDRQREPLLAGTERSLDLLLLADIALYDRVADDPFGVISYRGHSERYIDDIPVFPRPSC